MTDSLIPDTIRRALTSAGIQPGVHTSGIDIHRVIEDALSSEGLASPQPGPATTGSPRRTAPSQASDRGAFIWHRHTGTHGSRDYRLYVPTASADGAAHPLLLMLHGCKQHPDDFAAGTRMNTLAERHGFLVAYPGQTAKANGSNCWNWFETSQQQASGAEPSILAAIVDDIRGMHTIDRSKVYVAGLSAGAAMAVILGQTHPDVFAAVGAHSGLPKGVAHDVASAFAAMQARRAQPVAAGDRAVRTMVIHGDADSTVNIANGKSITRQALRAFEQNGMALQPQVAATAQHGGRRCTTHSFCDDLGMPQVVECVVHGGGHAWSGGDLAGSYTDASGPDASEEFVRFFLGYDAARRLVDA